MPRMAVGCLLHAQDHGACLCPMGGWQVLREPMELSKATPLTTSPQNPDPSRPRAPYPDWRPPASQGHSLLSGCRSVSRQTV